MEKFTCPVCKEKLIRKDNSLLCVNRHLYDIAKKGYVNLLMSQKSSDARHGDSKEMVDARSMFLNKGYYEPLRNEITSFLGSLIPNGASILDIGCGECYYTAGIMQDLSDKQLDFYGIDISKEALIAGQRRDKRLHLAVASAFEVPVADNSFDAIINLFAPHSETEYSRILKQNGFLIRVFPAENHLWDLKSAIYEHPYKNETAEIGITGFRTWMDQNLSYTIHLSNNEEIKALFGMTPYSYKTSENDERKLDALNSLSTLVDFRIVTYIKE